MQPSLPVYYTGNLSAKICENFCPRRTTKVLRKAFMVVSYPVGGGQVRGPRANFGHGYPPGMKEHACSCSFVFDNL